MGLDEYLNLLGGQIRCKKARMMVRREIADHIEDQKNALMEEGMSEEEALRESIRQMGDPVAAGVELDRLHRPAMDLKFLLMIGLFSLLGLAVQYLAQSLAGWGPELFFRQCILTAAGLGTAALVCFFDYTILGKYALWLWMSLTALFLLSSLASPVINGSLAYTQAGLYLYVPVFSGLLYRFRLEGIRGLLKCFLLAAVTFLLSVRLLWTLGTPAALAAIFLCLASSALLKGWFSLPARRALLLIWGTAVLLPALLFASGLWRRFLSDYQVSRLETWFSPMADPCGSTYQNFQALRLLFTARPLGPSPVPIQDVLGPLPSEYLLASAVNRWGLLPGLALLAALLALTARIIRLSRRLTNQLGSLTALGCALVFLFETLRSALANCGLSPSAARYLPFLSGGGRACLVTYVFCGLLLSVYRYKDVTGEIFRFPAFLPFLGRQNRQAGQ